MTTLHIRARTAKTWAVLAKRSDAAAFAPHTQWLWGHPICVHLCPSVVLLCLVTAFPLLAGIPYPDVLDRAAVVESQVSDINREGLVLGNGDLSGLLWERNGALCLRVTKNDVWDARVDTSQDPPLLRVDLPNQKWSGGSSSLHSYSTPYPQPRCAAIIRLGDSTETATWHNIRAGGTVNEWLRQGDTGIMTVEGSATVSAGYRYDLPPNTNASSKGLTFQISGNAEAQYYVNVLTRDGQAVVASGWTDSPPEEKEVSFALPDNCKVGALEFYVQSKSGAKAQNRIRRIRLEGATAPVVIASGMPGAGVKSARLDLRRAVATVDGTTARALADRNVFLIETDQAVALEEIKAQELPAAEQGVSDGVKWLHVKLPGDMDYAGMEYVLAVASAGKQKAVSLVTSRDTRTDVRGEAIRLARETVSVKSAKLVARHEAEWTRYWSASGVDLGDPDFQLWWYRMAYFLRCFAKAGVVPAGLWGVMPNDVPGWHGDYHHNYNAWQPYWTPLVLNHPDLADPWVRYMNEMLPRMRWLAKTTYDCEGACIGISSFAFEPDPANCKSVNRRQCSLVPWGYTMGMAGMSAQILWYCHLYHPDRKYLEEKIYPVVREVALFFCSFAEKCPRDADGKAKFGPSYSPEHGDFGVSNVPFDIAYARFTLNAAITAAGELGRDGELSARFRQALALLPPYPTALDAAGQPIVVDWTGCKFREIGEHNITVPVVPVFPADQVTWFSPEPEKELFRNTIRQTRHRGCNATVMFSVAKARFSMLDALDDARNYYKPQVQPNGMFYWPMHGFYLSESVGIAAMISEYLLQSVDNTIRVFPCWPTDKAASFTDLRAQGGFLVTAEHKAGKVTKLEITSTVGGKLRLLNPWSGKITEQETKPGQKLRFTQDGTTL